MRRILVIVLVMSAFTGTALAGGWAGSDQDGTLSVRDAHGIVWIKAGGAVVGRFDQGSIRVLDPVDRDTLDITVWGSEYTREVSDTTTIYGGTNVRFRIVGNFRIRIQGTGIDLSAVGQGRIGLNGDEGTYSLNGKARRPMPDNPLDVLTLADLGLPDSG